MKAPFTAYRVIRIDGWYDTDTTTPEEAGDTAAAALVTKAVSTAQFEGMKDGVEISDITDCGQSA